MAELAATIARRIRREGPLSIAAFMAIALLDPEGGYYARHDPLGTAGDFITAPEISQIFGELIGLWCADLWRNIGRPDPVILAELGPGSGALLEDFLRAAATLPEFRRALDLYLVEASPLLRDRQQRRLGSAGAHFVAGIDALPPGPLLLIANEFLDALPIRQLVRGRIEWAERLVALDAAGRLVFADGPENLALTLLVPDALRGRPPGSVVEICPAAGRCRAIRASCTRRSARASCCFLCCLPPSAAGRGATRGSSLASFSRVMRWRGCRVSCSASPMCNSATSFSARRWASCCRSRC